MGNIGRLVAYIVGDKLDIFQGHAKNIHVANGPVAVAPSLP